MTAGQTPSGSNQFPWFRIGTGALGAQQFRHHFVTERDARLERDMTRVRELVKGDISPQLYASYAARDHVAPVNIMANLTMLGGKHGGHDYSIPNSFGLEKTTYPTTNPLLRALQIKDETFTLNLYTSGKIRLLGRRGGKTRLLGRSGGYTPPAEPQILLEGGQEMTVLPNMSYEISEQHSQDSSEYLQNSEGRVVARSYTIPVPYTIPPVWFYVGGIAFVLAGGLLFDYVKRNFSKWIGSEDSQQSTSEVDENDSGRPQGEGPGLEVGTSSTQLMRPQSQAKPEFLLEVFTSYKRGTITKRAATRLLMSCHNLSEAEALDWLDDK